MIMDREAGKAAADDESRDQLAMPLPVRRLGWYCAVIFTLAVVALDVTETLAVVRGIAVDYLVIAVGLINPLSFLGVLIAIHLSAPVAKRMWSLIGLVFGSLWVALSVPAYFLQLTVVRWGDPSVPSFADLRAAPWAQNVLGWGLFLGIAALAVSRVFEGTRWLRLARWLLAASGGCMFVLLIGFAMSSTTLALAGGGIGWFLTLPAAGVVLAALFRRPDLAGRSAE
jgi:hypothetical protein